MSRWWPKACQLWLLCQLHSFRIRRNLPWLVMLGHIQIGLLKGTLHGVLFEDDLETTIGALTFLLFLTLIQSAWVLNRIGKEHLNNCLLQLLRSSGEDLVHMPVAIEVTWMAMNPESFLCWCCQDSRTPFLAKFI